MRWMFGFALLASGCVAVPEDARPLSQDEAAIAEAVADWADAPDECRDWASVMLVVRECPGGGDCVHDAWTWSAGVVGASALIEIRPEWVGDARLMAHEIFHAVHGCMFGRDGNGSHASAEWQAFEECGLDEIERALNR